MLPVYKGTAILKLGNNVRHEAHLHLGGFYLPVEKYCPGGKWIACLHRGNPAWFWDVPDAEGVWVIRIEIDNGQMNVRILSVKKGEVDIIVE